MRDLTQEELKKRLNYDPETGVFVWKRDASTDGRWNEKWTGQIAGHTRQSGYVAIALDAVPYYAHRLAWLYMTGAWPKSGLDHINRVKNDNRFCNLREASQSENNCNTTARRHNKSGYKGVSQIKRTGKWQAFIRINNRNRWLGTFDTPAEAHSAYCGAAKILHGEFARNS